MFRGRWLWSTHRAAVVRFRRADHLGSEGVPLAEAVRELVAAHCGERPTGPIRMLTQLRFAGYVINPVSFYYCFDDHGDRVRQVVAEVHNTPWGEQHCYVLPTARFSADPESRITNKEFHVSPFLPMETKYRWRMSRPGRRLNIHLENYHHAERVLDVTLALERREISSATLARVFTRYAWMPHRIAANIYWQAVKLWWKRCPFFPHPARQK